MGPLSYIVNILISSDLTVAQVGFFFSLTGLVSLLSVYSDMGMIESLNYYLPKYLVNKDYARAKGIFHFAIGVQICMTLFLTLVLYYGAIPLATYYFRSPQYTHIIEICSLFFIGLNILHIGTALFTVSQDTKMAKMADFVRAVCMAIGVVALYMSARGNVETYMWIYIISLFLGAVFGIFFAYRRYYAPYFSPVTAIYQRDILTPFAMYSLATLLTANIGMLFSQLDLQMVQYMLGLKEAGYYRQYLAIIGIPFLIFAPIVGFLFPLISEQHSR
jgi:O-antigen/teichoic acid export membrane protein